MIGDSMLDLVLEFVLDFLLDFVLDFEDFDEIGQSHWQTEGGVDTFGENLIDFVWVVGDKFLWKKWDWDETSIALDFVLDLVLDFVLDLVLDFKDFDEIGQ